MVKSLTFADVVSIGGCIVIGLIGAYFGYLMLHDDPLVGLVPVASSSLLILFGGLSLRAKPVVSPENTNHGDAPVRKWSAPTVMVLLVLYLLLVDVVGFMMDTAALIVLVLLASGIRRWATIVATLTVLLAVGFLFQNILGIELPRGMF
jgi:hypothetical protein